jgi:hypothetical protein
MNELKKNELTLFGIIKTNSENNVCTLTNKEFEKFNFSQKKVNSYLTKFTELKLIKLEYDSFHNRTITIINDQDTSTSETIVKPEFDLGVNVKTIIQPVVTKPVDNEETRRNRIKELFLSKNQPAKSEVKFSAVKNQPTKSEIKSYDEVVNIFKGVSVERVYNFFNKNLQPKIPNYLEYFTTTDENMYKKFAVETSNYLMDNFNCRKDMLEQFNEYREIVKTKEHQSLMHLEN